MFYQLISDRQARHKHPAPHTELSRGALYVCTIVSSLFIIEAELFGLVKINGRLHEQILQIKLSHGLFIILIRN